MTTPPEDRRQHTYARLASHRDPLLREIGDQLSSGVLRPSDLLTDPSYRNVLARSLRRVLAAIADLDAKNGHGHGHGHGQDRAPAPPGAGATPPGAGAAPPWEDGGPSERHSSGRLPDHGPWSREAGPPEWSER